MSPVASTLRGISIRCVDCTRLLVVLRTGQAMIEIKCARCKTVNTIDLSTGR